MKPARSRILFVSHSSGHYGAEKSLLTLLEGLKETGEYEIAVLLPDQGPLVTELRARRITFHITSYLKWIGKSSGQIANWQKATTMARLLLNLGQPPLWVKEWNPDLIYSNSVSLPFGIMLARDLRRPHIWHAREIPGGHSSPFSPGRRLLLQLANTRTDKIICISEALASALTGFFPRTKLCVVYNGFDFSAHPCPDAQEKYDKNVFNTSRIRLAIVGSIHPIKGQEDGLRALAILRERGFPVVLDIIGDGNQKHAERLGQLVNELALSDSVRFCGYVTDIAKEHATISVSLITSRWEPFGRVAVESLSCGTPVVASAAGGIPEIIQDSVTGLHYPPGDHVALAGKIDLLLKNRELYEACVRNGWQDVTHRFTKTRYVDDITCIINETLLGAKS